MNKRDFYKELMSEYMFDKEKICANAKKGKLAGRRPLPMYIGMTAAVAAAVVVIGTVVFTTFGNNNGVHISNKTSLAALSQEERLNRAIVEIKRNEGSEELIDVYITFRTALSPKQTHDLLKQFSEGSVPVKMLQMADGTTAMGTSEVAAVFKSNSGEVKAAVINCEGRRLAQINAHELVVLAEPVSENDNLADINPVSTDLNTPEINTSVPDTSKPDVSEPSGDNNNSTHEPPDIDDPGLPGGDIGDPDSSGSSSNDPGDSNSSGDSGSSGGSEDPSSGSSDPSSSSSNPSSSGSSGESNSGGVEDPVIVPGIPDGVTLPYDIDKQAFITDDLGAQRAYFLSDDVFYVKSEKAVSLYKWDGRKETLAVTQAISDAKVVWVSENGLRMMVSGTENGVRKKLFIIDAKNCTINDMKVGEMVGEGSIAEAAYNESIDLFALNVLDSGSRYIYTAKLSGYTPADPQIVVYGSNYLSLLGAYNNTVFYSDITGKNTVIYKCSNGDYSEVKALDGLYVSTLNSAFAHSLMISGSGISIFDPATESLIPVTADTVSFGASMHSFSDGKSYYTISAGAIVPEIGISEISKIDFTRSFSSKWAAAVSNGSVRIVTGLYSKRVKTDGIAFVQPAEKSTAEQRAAVNAAIGVLNAIAGDRCKECGLDTSEKLVTAIDACFSEGKAQYIKSSCGISGSGALSYSGSGLTVTSVSDTVLVMDGEFSGTLYVKVGLFDGMTAYRKVSITLVNNNGRLMMDCIV